MISKHHRHPEWLVDDTVGITDARVFICHTREPRFVGELLPDVEHDPSGVTIAAPNSETLCRIEWIDEPNVTSGMVQSLAEAIEQHFAVRGM